MVAEIINITSNSDSSILTVVVNYNDVGVGGATFYAQTYLVPNIRKDIKMFKAYIKTIAIRTLNDAVLQNSDLTVGMIIT